MRPGHAQAARRALFAVAALAALCVLALASPAEALTIRGRILKGEEHVPTPGVEVALHSVRDDQELPARTAVSDARGEFRFTGLSDDHALQYFVSTDFEGAFYTEGPIETAGKTDASRDLVIYDVGRDLASVSVTNHHIIVERKPEALHITEIVIFENRGTTAYLGTGLNHAENAGVRLGLPASVKNFEPGMGGDAQTVNVQGRDLSSARPIRPGTHPFSFGYDVPLSGRMDLSHRLYFPTEKFVVLLDDPSLKLQTSSLTYDGSRDQGGRKFEVYQGSNFPVGAEVSMRVGGASFWSNPRIYPWLAAPFAITAVLIIARRRGRRASEAIAPPLAPAPPSLAGHAAAAAPPRTHQAPAPSRTHHASHDGDEDLQSVYLYLISALDQGLERGEFSSESHALIRGNLKRRLEVIVSDRIRTGTR